MKKDRAPVLAVATFAASLAGCDGGPDTIPLQEIRVTLTPTDTISGADSLHLRMNPTRITHDGRTDAVLDESNQTTCKKDPVTGIGTCETRPAARRWVNITLFDLNHLLAGTNSPLYTRRIVESVVMDPGQYTRVAISAISEPNVDDSYVELSDGRRCEVRFRAPDGSDSIEYPIDLRIERSEDWDIHLTVALSATTIDPAQCEAGYDVYGTPAAVSIERNMNPGSRPVLNPRRLDAADQITRTQIAVALTIDDCPAYNHTVWKMRPLALTSHSRIIVDEMKRAVDGSAESRRRRHGSALTHESFRSRRPAPLAESSHRVPPRTPARSRAVRPSRARP